VSLLGIRHVVLAVNKMDLVDFDRPVFDEIEADYRDFAEGSAIETSRHPDVGAEGDNIVERGETRPGTTARPCWSILETVEVDERPPKRSRSACRCNGSTGRTSTSAASPADRLGTVRPGDRSRCLPGAQGPARSQRIVTMDGDLDERVAGQSVTLTLSDEIDARAATSSRRRRIRRGGRPVRGHMLWMADEPMLPGRPTC
jgi:bifunctional enzyme CysN/CysC